MKEFKCGYIHSIETMGLVDGPGIRVVVFMQGCMLRCLFCHNPDTWNKKSKYYLSSKEVVDQIRKYRPYIEQGGGVTFSGGEPLMQSEFLLEMLKLCKKSGIHTCIDTSGTAYNKNYFDSITKNIEIVKGYTTDKNKVNYRKDELHEIYVNKLKISNEMWISINNLCDRRNKNLLCHASCNVFSNKQDLSVSIKKDIHNINNLIDKIIDDYI